MAKKQTTKKMTTKVEAPSVPATAVPANAVQARQRADFLDRYASNVQFDQSIWGMRIIFGEFRTEQGQPWIEQHTGITMPWPAIKLLIAYLEVNLVMHENAFGSIDLPTYLLPPFPPDIAPGVRENPEQFAKATRFHKTIADIHERFGIKKSE